MEVEQLFKKLISELNLIANQRMAVIYTVNLGDFYSLCTTIEYAEKALDKEAIVLYFSDRHNEMLGWFAYDGYTIKSHRISKDEFFMLLYANIDIQRKYQDCFISWRCGDSTFRNFTRNGSPEFAPCLRAPHFPKVSIREKYSEVIQPGKTVLIIPESTSVQTFPLWFWNISAKILEYMGFNVIFNVSPDRSSLFAGKTVLAPVSEIVSLANECGYVYGVRCGLFDILNTSTARMTIFSTKSYKPLNEVFRIPNSDNRIRTYYYTDMDPFFTKTEPISTVQNYFEQFHLSFQELFQSLCRNDSKCDSAISTAKILKSYSCVKIFNKYDVGRLGTHIAPFVEVNYSADIVDSKYVLSVYDLSASKYRFDYKVYLNDRLVSDLKDIKSPCLPYPLIQSGEYYIRVIITDIETANQEYFDTDRLLYSAPIPNDIRKLRYCGDFQAYIAALANFSQYITVYISSRDAHTAFKKNKNTQVLRYLRLLGLKIDFETTCRYSYIGVIDGGVVIDEKLSSNEKLRAEYEIDNNKAIIESVGYNASHNDKTPIKIEINGKDVTVNKRGLNIVVWDKEKNTLIDSVVFDTFFDSRATRSEKNCSIT